MRPNRCWRSRTRSCSARLRKKAGNWKSASRHKSQFLANMSHELRTPLNSVLGFTELLVDGIYGELPDKAKTTLARVQANGRHLLGLINDVLDLSKIEAGQLTLAIEDYSVGQIVRSTVAAVEPLGASERSQLSSDRCREHFQSDAATNAGLTQVLLNLAGNAVKFTETGSVDILADAVDGTSRFSVRDTGPGIASEDQSRIFEEFQQVDNSSTRQKGGTGLGLAISKRIVEMHGGTIDVESVLGSGSTFRVKIPIRVEEKCGGRMSKRILMVEDTEDNRQIIRDLMSHHRLRIDRGGGRCCWRCRCSGQHKPDLILMDIQLPGDGRV